MGVDRDVAKSNGFSRSEIQIPHWRYEDSISKPVLEGHVNVLLFLLIPAPGTCSPDAPSYEM